MAQHSVAEAKNHLSELIDQAIAGEDVVITRHGRAVVELRAMPAEPKPMTEADFAWLAEVRSMTEPGPVDAGTFVSRMRDEDWR